MIEVWYRVIKDSNSSIIPTWSISRGKGYLLINNVKAKSSCLKYCSKFALRLMAGTVNEKIMVKSALIESKKLLDFYIESTDDLNTEQIESVKHFIKALKAGCSCDDYNGFDCGCGKRAFLCDEALKELEGSTCY